MKRQLSKETQETLMWQYHDDAHLQLIYGSFDNFVKSRVGEYQKPADKDIN